ncbi:MAG: hypothetical protein PHT75_00845 [Bacilli bacterium]|nr:hypothetical protein [Bacilli bacterium]MDD3304662.1 hypothetical protein [Bacilli bacterium]MDD4053286.1 hypothetical protein [Bacilli bacterium]MDD4411373.1 hypothetical protein [Bacilli bacterium]
MREGEGKMAPATNKHKYYLIVFFVLIIIYLVGSLYHEFHYLDFGYLLVVIVIFVRLLNEKERN